jgi:hypothetical protein
MRAYRITKHQVFPRVEAKDMESAAALALTVNLSQANTVEEGKLTVTVEPFRVHGPRDEGMTTRYNSPKKD